MNEGRDADLSSFEIKVHVRFFKVLVRQVFHRAILCRFFFQSVVNMLYASLKHRLRVLVASAGLQLALTLTMGMGLHVVDVGSDIYAARNWFVQDEIPIGAWHLKVSQRAVPSKDVDFKVLSKGRRQPEHVRLQPDDQSQGLGRPDPGVRGCPRAVESHPRHLQGLLGPGDWRDGRGQAQLEKRHPGSALHPGHGGLGSLHPSCAVSVS
jgi:hypothetical protein